MELEGRAEIVRISKKHLLKLLDLYDPYHAVPSANPYSTLAYAVRASDVRHVAVDGRLVVRDRELLTLDRARVIADARKHAARVLAKL